MTIDELKGYTHTPWKSDLTTLLSKTFKKEITPDCSIEIWIDQLPKSCQPSAKAYDKLAKEGSILQTIEFQQQYYGFYFEKNGLLVDQANHYLSLDCNGSGDHYLLELLSGS